MSLLQIHHLHCFHLHHFHLNNLNDNIDQCKLCLHPLTPGSPEEQPPSGDICSVSSPVSQVLPPPISLGMSSGSIGLSGI